MSFRVFESGADTVSKVVTKQASIKASVIKAQVILGSPAAGCTDVGICRVLPHGRANPFPCQANAALLSISGGGDDLYLSFQADDFDLHTYAQHFGSGQFVIKEPLMLPAFVRSFFSLPVCSIVPGIYPVYHADNQRVMLIRLKKTDR